MLNLPQELMRLGHYVWMARVLMTSVEMDIYSTVGEDGADLEKVSEKTGASARGMRGLLNALIPMGLLTVDDEGVYHLTDFSRATLIRGAPGYTGTMVNHMSRLWESWGDLTESIRSGEPHWKRHKPTGGISHLVDLAEGLYPRNLMVSTMAAEALEAGEKWKGLEILDVGAGSGAWSLAFLKKDASATALALDFEPVLEMAKRKAEELGLAQRFRVQAGNIREVDFGEEKFDLVILGHICHSEGPEHSKGLIDKSARSLKPGGKLLIADMIPDDDRRGPMLPLLFALNMLVNTMDGGTFTLSEYHEWCQAAGLKETRLMPMPVEGHSPLIVADKPR